MSLSSPLVLPCKAVLKNRFAKSAMSEQLGDLRNRPTKEIQNLYKTWAESEAGLLITGNIMVNFNSLGEPRNIVLNGNELYAKEFKLWVKASLDNNQHIWPQLNHPGRQALKAVSSEILAPSPSKVNVIPGMFGQAKQMTEKDITGVIQDFVTSAKWAKEFGFTGIQIHAAHGYLISQFLSPLINKRDDQWGGSVENRARFLQEIIKGIRSQVGPDFPIGVKINSADFQRGGFSEDDCLIVLKMLDESTVDLIELSGGTYEAAAMISGTQKESSKKREAFFIDFAEKAKTVISTPLMLTGGFRTKKGMQEAIDSKKVDIIGLARPLVWDPMIIKKFLSGEADSIHCNPPSLPLEKLKHMAEMTWYVLQIRNIGYGKKIDHKSNSVKELIKYIAMSQTDAMRKKFIQ